MSSEYPRDDNVLISVQTVPAETNGSNTNLSVVDGSAEMVDENETNKCFVCNSSENRPFTNLFDRLPNHPSRSNHSKESTKLIINLVWKILGEEPSMRMKSIDDISLEDEVVCAECLEEITEFDYANSTAKRAKKQLCNRLAKTEAHFSSIENGAKVNDDAKASNDAKVFNNAEVNNATVFAGFRAEKITRHGNAPSQEDVVDLCDE